MQGERTIYTVECQAGSWNGDRCSGQLVAGPRYRYRALPPHSEVRSSGSCTNVRQDSSSQHSETVPVMGRGPPLRTVMVARPAPDALKKALITSRVPLAGSVKR